MLNSPVNHTDPTGHYCVEIDENGDPVHVDCETGDNNDDPDDALSGGGGGDGNGGDPTPDVTNPENPLVDILETIIADDFQALVDNDCFTETPGTIDWTNSRCVDAVSFAFQDLATGLSSASATWTAILTVLGCAPSSGVGCGAGYLLGVADHVFYFNPLESTASTISFGLTVYSDFLTQDTYFSSFTAWGVGEDTKTGSVTFVAGLLTVEPFFDAGIDLYASGYNHGYYCGISTVASCIESMISGFP